MVSVAVLPAATQLDAPAAGVQPGLCSPAFSQETEGVTLKSTWLVPVLYTVTVVKLLGGMESGVKALVPALV